MTCYLTRRAATYLLVLVAALTINFFLPRALPGSPVEELSSGVGSVAVAMDPATLAALQHYYGLDQPLFRQFVHYLTGLARGDLGFSISYKAPVGKVIARALPWTLLLAVSALLLSFLLAVIWGTRFGLNKSKYEGVVLVPAVILDSMPPFILGSFFLIALGVKLQLLPVSGAYTNFVTLNWWQGLADIVLHALLPVLALAVGSFFSAYLLVRNAVRLVKDEPYVLLARVKGLDERVIRYRYVLRTALLPVVTFFAMRLAHVMGGAMLVEVLFAYPGLGRLTYEAVLNHDYPMLQGIFFIFTLWILAVNLITDLVYLKLDPRVKEV